MFCLYVIYIKKQFKICDCDTFRPRLSPSSGFNPSDFRSLRSEPAFSRFLCSPASLLCLRWLARRSGNWLTTEPALGSTGSPLKSASLPPCSGSSVFHQWPAGKIKEFGPEQAPSNAWESPSKHLSLPRFKPVQYFTFPKYLPQKSRAKNKALIIIHSV